MPVCIVSRNFFIQNVKVPPPGTRTDAFEYRYPDCPLFSTAVSLSHAARYCPRLVYSSAKRTAKTGATTTTAPSMAWSAGEIGLILFFWSGCSIRYHVTLSRPRDGTYTSSLCGHGGRKCDRRSRSLAPRCKYRFAPKKKAPRFINTPQTAVAIIRHLELRIDYKYVSGTFIHHPYGSMASCSPSRFLAR